MIIGFDVDGVLADFNSAFITRVVQVTGKDLFPPRPFDIPTWNYPEHYGYSKEDTTAVWNDIKADPSFWSSLNAYAEVVPIIRWASKLAEYGQADVYFITNRMGQSPKAQTELWLSARGVDSPTVLISESKGLCAKALKLDIYVDDKNENCADVATQSPFTTVFMQAQPWNKEVPGTTRVASLSAVVSAVQQRMGSIKA
jgi:5'(3')-deoxyribonucleotidase